MNGEEEAGDLEQTLELARSAYTRLLAWAKQHYRDDGGDRGIDMADFGQRGMLLSRELQRELGSTYAVSGDVPRHLWCGGLLPVLARSFEQHCLHGS